MIGGRFAIEHPLNAALTLYRARDTQAERQVLLRVEDLSTASSFDALNRLEREAALLRGLKHPQIPAFVASGQDGSRAYLALEHVEGETLEEEMQARRYHETEVLDVIADVLPVLGYLHGLSPPVVHRDLTPGALVRRGSDGRLILRDLGSALGRASSAGELTTSGTYGYLAPEQFTGDAFPASDLYALGVIAVRLLSREDPESMMRERRIDWESRVSCHNATRLLLRDLLAPELDARLADARIARTRVERVRVLVLDATKPAERREEEAATELNLPSSKYLKTRPVNEAEAPSPASRRGAHKGVLRIDAASTEHEIARKKRNLTAAAFVGLLLMAVVYLLRTWVF